MSEKLYTPEEEERLRHLRPNSEEARAINSAARQRYRDSRSDLEVRRDALIYKAKGNAPGRVRKSDDTEAYQAAVRKVTGLNDRNFNPFTLDRNRDVKFGSLTVEQQKQTYRMVLGRDPTEEERTSQANSWLSHVVAGGETELRDRGLSDFADKVKSWDKARSDPSHFRTFTTMAVMAGSLVFGPAAGAALAIGNRVGWAAYDEMKGEDVAWEEVATDVGVAASAFSGNPFITGGTAAAATYARGGDAGDALTSGALTAYSTNASSGVRIMAQAANEALVNDADINDVFRNAATAYAIRRTSDPGGRMVLRAGNAALNNNLNEYSMISIMAQNSSERAQARKNPGGKLRLPAEKDFWDPSGHVEKTFSRENTTSLSLLRSPTSGELYPGTSLFIGRKAPPPRTPASSGSVGQMQRMSQPRRAPSASSSNKSEALTRGGFEIY